MSLFSLPVPTDLSSLIAAMERLHRPKGPYVAHLAPTNEPFLSFSTAGVYDEGEPVCIICLSPESAIQTYWFNFLKVSIAHPGSRLYWRSKPSLKSIEAPPAMVESTVSFLAGSRLHLVHSRFVLSSKPIVSKQFEEECLGKHKKANIQSGDAGREAVQKIA